MRLFSRSPATAVAILVLLLAGAACGTKDTSTASDKGSATAGPPPRTPTSVKDDLVGTDPNKLAFETKPLIGMTLEELQATYGQYRMDTVSSTIPQMFTIPGGIAFPNANKRFLDLEVHLDWERGRIVGYWFVADPMIRADLVAALTAVRGTPFPTGAPEQQGLMYGTSPQLVVTSKAGYVKVLVHT